MKSLPGREQDYAFGQVMLTLRTAIGLTQSSLAEYLGVSRHAVGEWEAGNSYPKSRHLKQFIALAVKHRAFTGGQAEEEIRGLWRMSRQKVLLDEAWLTSLFSTEYRVPTTERSPLDPAHDTRYSVLGTRIDWGDALTVPTFYGREWELSLLSEWMVEERCQVVGVLGLGGIGKSALAVRLMQGLAERFDVVIWRSLRNAPSLETLLDDCLQVLSPQSLGQMPGDSGVAANIDQRLGLLLECMRSKRIMLVLDNLETLLEQGEDAGRLRDGYEAFGQLLREVAETRHQSCLLFTSREKPADLVTLEGGRSPVRVLRLARLDVYACERLLEEKNIRGNMPERTQLIEAYTGNPLALKIVAETIVELFDGAIAPFLKQGAIIFGGVRELLAQQFNRLSVLEQSIMFWLAIMREPVTFDDLRAVLVTSVPRAQLLEGVEALRRRSLIERGGTAGSFTLQSVVLEYVTDRLVAEASDEIQQGRLTRLLEHSLTVALAPEYVRQMQEQLIVGSVLERLGGAFPHRASLEAQLEALLREARTHAEDVQGYGPANLVALFFQLHGDLRGLDLSGLALRHVYFQGIEMQDTSLSQTLIRDSIFTDSFGTILSVGISHTGRYLAASSRQGDIRLWSADDYSLQRIWTDRDVLYNFALSPDGQTMAVINWNGVIKLWVIENGALLWSLDQPDDVVNRMLFSPDGRFIATGDTRVRLWDARTGAHLQTLQQPVKPHHVAIYAIGCSPDGQWLASGDTDGLIYLWALNGAEAAGQATLVQTIEGHAERVVGLAFAADSGTLASASSDGTVKLWAVAGGGLNATLAGNRGPISGIAWSPDGSTLACGGQDRMIWLWDVAEADFRVVLRGHTSRVKGLAFTPDSRSLLSGSDDGTLRVWDVQSGQCAHVIRGHALAIYYIRWSPDGNRLVSGSSDQLLTIFKLKSTNGPGNAQERMWTDDWRPHRATLLRGHQRLLKGLAWSPDGRWLASSDQGNQIRLWDADSEECVELLQYPDDTGTTFDDLDWSPDGRMLAAATRKHGVLLWDMSDMAALRERPARQMPAASSRVKWSPDGTRLASKVATEDVADTICVWAAADGALLQRLGPVGGEISDFGWSPTGRMLILDRKAGEEGAFLVWETQWWECIHAFGEPSDGGSALAWGPDEEVVISGSSDGSLKWWDTNSGECMKVAAAHTGPVLDITRSPDGSRLASCGMDGAIMLWDLHSGEYLETVRRDRPYERLNITGIRGLTEAQKATLLALGAIEDGGAV